MAQGNSKGKGHGHGNGNGNGHGEGSENGERRENGEGKEKDHKKDLPSYPIVTQGTHSNTTEKGYSKNQPKKVQAALLRDYPGATNVVWNKYKGDYTASFNNGIWRSTSVYHANGERRDTRTVLTRQQLPGTIWDRIFKRDRIAPTQYIQIERPSTAEKIFRILSGNSAYFYDQNGNKVAYSY